MFEGFKAAPAEHEIGFYCFLLVDLRFNRTLWTNRLKFVFEEKKILFFKGVLQC